MSALWDWVTVHGTLAERKAMEKPNHPVELDCDFQCPSCGEGWTFARLGQRRRPGLNMVFLCACKHWLNVEVVPKLFGWYSKVRVVER